MVAALVLLGAVCFRVVAAYQWSMFAARDWKTRIWSSMLAIILWLAWLYGTTHGLGFLTQRSGSAVDILFEQHGPAHFFSDA
jgi:phosphoglycolate phosphatase-like HAD superfamily hydrolase